MPAGPRPLTPDVAEVTMEFKYDGQYCYNTHHFYNESGWDEGSLNNLGTLVKNWWTGELQASIPSTCILTAITCRDLSETAGLETAVTTGLPAPGGYAGPAMPNHVTIAVGKKTGRAGRAYSGRTYHIGLREDTIVANTLDPAQVTYLTDKYNMLRDLDGPLSGIHLVVLSEVVAGAWRPQGIATEVTGIKVDSTIDSQRRRLPGRGR